MQGVLTVPIEEEMKRSYLDYAMSTIIGRALPDARDGLKPVHRRILFAMYEMGNTHDKPHKKSARVVGDVIGKYHPHGDQAVYEAITRMVQNFSMRYPLIDGQGNFGSIDGDEPAAMRYTEVRLSKVAEEMLKDIEKETVPFRPNYDDTLREPVVLPSRVPNLLINGSSGIAVGMATNIPPHNLSEVVDGIIAYIDNPEITIDGLLNYIKGPDFPTRGIIYGKSGIRDAYEKGRGHIILRAKTEIEKKKDGREVIIVTEIPFQVNKAKLIEDIAELVNQKKIEGISTIRDESDREGMRIVIELKRGERATPILNKLYKHTQLQTTFGIIFLAVVENEPLILNLKELIRVFVEFRKEIVRKRTEYELTKALDRIHILEGLGVAVEHIEEVVELIKRSKNRDEAKEKLCSRFNLSERQALSILEMRLQRLTSLERERLIEEQRETKREIERLKTILRDERVLLQVIKDELLELKNTYGDKRLTEIIEERPEIKIEDMIKDEEVVIMLSRKGYIKRTSLAQFRHQSRGGKGRVGIILKDDDFLEHIALASTLSTLIFLTDRGRAYRAIVHSLPEAAITSKGKPISSLIELNEEESIVSLVSFKELKEEDSHLFLVTKKGYVKKIKASFLSSIKKSGIRLINLPQDDELVAAFLAKKEEDIIIATKKGLSIRFNGRQIREMGRNAYGVRGIRLQKDDEVRSAEALQSHNYLFTVTERGYGKKVQAQEYRIQSKGGKGIKNLSCKEKNGFVLFVKRVNLKDEIILATDKGKIIRFKVDEIPVQKRGGIGVKVINLGEEKLAGIGVIHGET